tara:strand:- start:170 stop:1045 length:876 start_codon:yes stop_codon:yes gene_type:complete
MAETLRLGVVDVLEPLENENFYAVFATDGQVYDVHINDTEVIAAIKDAQKSGLEVEFETSDHTKALDVLAQRSEILGVKLLTSEFKVPVASKNQAKGIKDLDRDPLMTDYISDIGDSNTLNNVFRAQKTGMRKRSQCYNRAHVWSYEMRNYSYNGRRVQPGKVWLFFTKKYIRAYRYKWWFHVSPYVNSNGVKKVMDRRYMQQPADLRYWTNYFIQSQQECRRAKVYTDYERNPQLGHCFVIFTSVHYWQPWQIEKNEENGTLQTQWSDYELRIAYRDALGRRYRRPNLNK